VLVVEAGTVVAGTGGLVVDSGTVVEGTVTGWVVVEGVVTGALSGGGPTVVDSGGVEVVGMESGDVIAVDGAAFGTAGATRAGAAAGAAGASGTLNTSAGTCASLFI